MGPPCPALPCRAATLKARGTHSERPARRARQGADVTPLPRRRSHNKRTPTPHPCLWITLGLGRTPVVSGKRPLGLSPVTRAGAITPGTE